MGLYVMLVSNSIYMMVHSYSEYVDYVLVQVPPDTCVLYIESDTSRPAQYSCTVQL
jgi:hypothetical protein